MLGNTFVFNQPIGNWDVSNVTSMISTFNGANSFNQDIGNWNVGKVTDMRSMFQNASSFNQNISTWNVGNVGNVVSMFQNAASFNQNLSSWTTNVANTAQPANFSTGANATFANNANLRKPFLRGGTIRITT
jgi:surface protein